MNDKCVSANFKKEPEAGGMAHVCELNNATHLDYDTDLITDVNFYHRGSKVRLKFTFLNWRIIFDKIIRDH